MQAMVHGGIRVCIEQSRLENPLMLINFSIEIRAKPHIMNQTEVT